MDFFRRIPYKPICKGADGSVCDENANVQNVQNGNKTIEISV